VVGQNNSERILWTLTSASKI